MAEIKVADLPVMIEGDFTGNDRFMVVDDGKARQLPLGVFQTWLLANVQGEQGLDGLSGRDGTNGKDGVNGKDGKDGLSSYQVAVNGGYIGTQAQWLASLKGLTGTKGLDGYLGWSPALRVVSRGDENVLELHDWTGGTGTKPTTLGYVGSTGIVTNILNASNIKGLKGDKGDIGLTGLTGAAGLDGKTISGVVIENDATITINFSDATNVKSNTPPQQRGWATYKDGEYKVANPFTISTASQVVLPNNGIEKIENLPQGVSTFYNTVSQKYILTDIKGFYNIRVRFKAVANASPSYINLSMSKDTTETPYSEDRALRGDSTIQDLSFSTELYGDAALSSNSLTIRIKTYDRAVSIYNIEVMIAKVI